MSQKEQILQGATRAKKCRCRQISVLFEATAAKEKAKAYNELISVVNDILKQILVNHDRGKISPSLKVRLEIYEEHHESYIIYEEPIYCIAWTKNGVAEFENGTFLRHIEFYEIDPVDKLASLHHCHCDGNTLDFLTLADMTRSIIEEKAPLLGFDSSSITSLREKCKNCWGIADFLKQAI